MGAFDVSLGPACLPPRGLCSHDLGLSCFGVTSSCDLWRERAALNFHCVGRRCLLGVRGERRFYFEPIKTEFSLADDYTVNSSVTASDRMEPAKRLRRRPLYLPLVSNPLTDDPPGPVQINHCHFSPGVKRVRTRVGLRRRMKIYTGRNSFSYVSSGK